MCVCVCAIYRMGEGDCSLIPSSPLLLFTVTPQICKPIPEAELIQRPWFQPRPFCSLSHRIDKGNCGLQRNAWNVPCRSWTTKYWETFVVGVGSFVAGDTRKRELQGNFFNARLCLAPLMFGKPTSFYSTATPNLTKLRHLSRGYLDETEQEILQSEKENILSYQEEMPKARARTRHFSFGAASSHLLSKDGTQESPDMTLAIFIWRNSKHILECINTIWL